MLRRMPTSVLHIFSGKQLAGGEIAALAGLPGHGLCRGRRSVVSSLSSRQALPKRCDILPERLIGGPIRPRQREQNRHQNVGEHRRDGDVAGPRRICRLEKRGGVGAEIAEFGGEIIRLGGPAPANRADLGGSSQSEVFIVLTR